MLQVESAIFAETTSSVYIRRSLCNCPKRHGHFKFHVLPSPKMQYARNMAQLVHYLISMIVNKISKFSQAAITLLRGYF